VLVVGLTGGIGSGKSAAADLFAKLGVPIIDTDLLARDVVQPGSDLITAIQQHFGPRVIQADGQLDRQALRVAIFNDRADRQWLEQLLHPLIRQMAKQEIAALDAPYCILVIPLLVENMPHPLVDRILVIDCPEAIQIARIQPRDHVSAAQVFVIIESQATREERLAVADDVILNDRDLKALEDEVHQYHQKITAKKI